MRMLSPSRLRAIAAVAEHGTYAAAARSLGVSHAAVSQQIREMEAEHGIRLFDRVEGVLRATPVCLELSDIGQRIRHAEADATRILDRRNAQGKPRLRLGLGNSMPGVAIAASMLARQPGLAIEVESGSHHHILGAVLRREVEAAVLPDIPPDPRFRRHPVLTQEVVAIVAPESPLARLDTVSLMDLADLPLVFRSRGSSTQKVVDRAFRRAGLTPEPRLVADTRDAVYEAVALGVGVGFMWRFGTFRKDGVRRLEVPELGGGVEEVAFALADERNEMVQFFFAAAEDHSRAAGPATGGPTPGGPARSASERGSP
jgi:DNA-binding transcriptional LysR family regulator